MSRAVFRGLATELCAYGLGHGRAGALKWMWGSTPHRNPKADGRQEMTGDDVLTQCSGRAVVCSHAFICCFVACMWSFRRARLRDETTHRSQVAEASAISKSRCLEFCHSKNPAAVNKNMRSYLVSTLIPKPATTYPEKKSGRYEYAVRGSRWGGGGACLLCLLYKGRGKTTVET